MEQQGQRRSRTDPENVAGDIPQPGDVVAGTFVVERALGVGGMGIVVARLATPISDRPSPSSFCGKAGGEGSRHAVSRFPHAEARDVAALQSDHVVRVMGQPGCSTTGCPSSSWSICTEPISARCSSVGGLSLSTRWSGTCSRRWRGSPRLTSAGSCIAT